MPERREADAIEPFDAVIFGGRGDLAMRKLLPALYYRHESRQLPDQGRIIGVGRSPLSDGEYRAWAEHSCRAFIAPDGYHASAWEGFAKRLFYLPVDATSPDGYAALATLLGQFPERVRMFYLATAPDLFTRICQGLDDAGLVTSTSRVVLEKPLGHDLASAQAINYEVSRV